jgi:hypothetical protein
MCAPISRRPTRPQRRRNCYAAHPRASLMFFGRYKVQLEVTLSLFLHIDGAFIAPRAGCDAFVSREILAAERNLPLSPWFEQAVQLQDASCPSRDLCRKSSCILSLLVGGLRLLPPYGLTRRSISIIAVISNLKPIRHQLDKSCLAHHILASLPHRHSRCVHH